jgi:hypothetical protein
VATEDADGERDVHASAHGEKVDIAKDGAECLMINMREGRFVGRRRNLCIAVVRGREHREQG